jgi:hypothetical protein
MKMLISALAIILAICVLAPLLVISETDIEGLQAWYQQLGMGNQALTYAFLRLIAYPWYRGLQEALLHLHGGVGCALVMTIGEIVGSGAQILIFECVPLP